MIHSQIDSWKAIFDGLVQSGRLPGSVQGRGDAKDFVPAIFTRHTTGAIEQFYRSNGYIEYQKLKTQFQVTQPLKYLEGAFPDGIPLTSSLVSPSVLSLMESSLEETVARGEWSNAQQLLPSPLTDEDVELLLRDHCCVLADSKKPLAILFARFYVVSCGFLTELLRQYEERFQLWALEDVNSRKELLSSTDSLRSSSSSLGSDESDFNEQSDEAPKGKKGKRRKAKSRAAAPASGAPAGRSMQLAESFVRENKDYMKDFHSDLPEELIDAIEAEIRSRLVDLREAAARALFMDSSAKKKFEGSEWHVEVKQLYCNIQLFCNAAMDYSGDSVPLEKHLLRTLCTDLANLLVEASAALAMVKLDDETITTGKQRTGALKKLQKTTYYSSLQALVDTLTKPSCQTFLGRVEDLFLDIGVVVKPLDKKSEKILVAAHQEALQTQFRSEANPANAFHLGVMVLYVGKVGQVLHSPGKMIADVLQVSLKRQD